MSEFNESSVWKNLVEKYQVNVEDVKEEKIKKQVVTLFQKIIHTEKN